MPPKIQYEQVKKFIEDHDYKLLTKKEKYKNTLTKLDIECKDQDCKYIFHPTFKDFKKGTRCPKAANNLRIDFKTIIDYVFLRGDILLSQELDYKNNKTKLKIECGICKYIFYPCYNNYKDNETGCIKCENKLKIEYEKVVDFIDKQGDKLLTEKGDYKNNATVLTIQCGICNELFYPPFYQYKNRNTRCRKCGIKKMKEKLKLSFEFVKNYIENDKKYVLVSETYINSKIKLKIKCLKCNKIFNPSFNQFKNRESGCPNCNQSHGERKIQDYLTKNNIKFVPQYKIENCKNKRCLPFDFYLPEFNKLIEFDGKQHFKVNKFFGEKAFEQTQIHDNIKTNYCNNNNIFLLRIDYTEIKNIDYWLDKFLNENFGINGESLILLTNEEKYEYLDLLNL